MQSVPGAEGMHCGSQPRLARFRGEEDKILSASGDDIWRRTILRGNILRTALLKVA